MNFFFTFCLIGLVICQEQQAPALPAPNFGRDYSITQSGTNARGDFSSNSFTRNAVCSNPNNYGFVQRSGTTKFYSIADLMMMWLDGENYCQSFGGHLPVIRSQADQDFLRCKFFLTI